LRTVGLGKGQLAFNVVRSPGQDQGTWTRALCLGALAGAPEAHQRILPIRVQSIYAGAPNESRELGKYPNMTVYTQAISGAWF
jgi:hypothetical protein